MMCHLLVRVHVYDIVDEKILFCVKDFYISCKIDNIYWRTRYITIYI